MDLLVLLQAVPGHGDLAKNKARIAFADGVAFQAGGVVRPQGIIVAQAAA